MIKSSVENAIKGVIADAPEAFDTLREIADLIANDETGVVALANAISANNKAINTEVTRAKEAEQAIKEKAVDADSLNFQTRANVVALNYKTIEEVGDEITIPSATTEKAGVMSAEDKKTLDNVPSKIESAITKESKATDEKIADEKTRAEQAEQAINDKLDDEIERSASADLDLLTSIDEEARRATGAEQANANAIGNEVARATQAEAEAVERGRQLALRALFVAAGAEYNDTDTNIAKTSPWGEVVQHLPKHYYLNGLGDITEEQMMEIYNAKDIIYRLDGPRILQNDKKRRTIFPCISTPVESILRNRKLDGGFSFYDSNIEELIFHSSSQEVLNQMRLMPTQNLLSHTFYNCVNLRRIGGINCNSVTSFINTFDGCTSLEEVRLYNITRNLSFASSSKISKASILYMVQYAIPTSAITITLHADAYARLNPDLEENADIKSALEAQPLITLASA
jgi:hypothetical protein